MKVWSTVVVWSGLGMALLASGCDTSSPSLPCDEGRDSPECLAALDAAVQEYAAAVCENDRECYPASRWFEGDLATCTKRLTERYQPIFRLDAVLATPDEILACAKALRAPDCDVYGSGDPACLLRGSTKAGKGCGSDFECETAECVFSGPGCGVCTTTRAKGQVCDVEDSDCGPGLACFTSSGTCQPRVETGEACSHHDECASNLLCSNGTCGPPLALGQPCVYDECDQGSSVWCNSVTNQCDTMPIAPAGDPCGYADDGQYHLCGYGLYCSTGTCKARPIDGQDCSGGAPCVSPAQCVDGLCSLAADHCL